MRLAAQRRGQPGGAASRIASSRARAKARTSSGRRRLAFVPSDLVKSAFGSGCFRARPRRAPGSARAVVDYCHFTMTVRRFRNPILSGFYPDPSVVRAGEWFYLVNSSFEMFPGVPIHRSRDLVHWEALGHVLTRDSQLPLAEARPSRGIFAPTLRHHAGTFY